MPAIRTRSGSVYDRNVSGKPTSAQRTFAAILDLLQDERCKGRFPIDIVLEKIHAQAEENHETLGRRTDSFVASALGAAEARKYIDIDADVQTVRVRRTAKLLLLDIKHRIDGQSFESSIERHREICTLVKENFPMTYLTRAQLLQDNQRMKQRLADSTKRSASISPPSTSSSSSFPGINTTSSLLLNNDKEKNTPLSKTTTSSPSNSNLSDVPESPSRSRGPVSPLPSPPSTPYGLSRTIELATDESQPSEPKQPITQLGVDTSPLHKIRSSYTELIGRFQYLNNELSVCIAQRNVVLKMHGAVEDQLKASQNENTHFRELIASLRAELQQKTDTILELHQSIADMKASMPPEETTPYLL